jgi:hypothetical protein
VSSSQEHSTHATDRVVNNHLPNFPNRQEILPSPSTPSSAPYQYAYPAILPNNSILPLPIRPLPSQPDHAVASLLINQASFRVAETLESELARLLEPFKPDIVIGLPTLGLGPASTVARKLGHCKWKWITLFSFREISGLMSKIDSTLYPSRLLPQILVHRHALHAALIYHFSFRRETCIPGPESTSSTQKQKGGDC